MSNRRAARQLVALSRHEDDRVIAPHAQPAQRDSASPAVVQLQRVIGNQGMIALLRSGRADAVAQTVQNRVWMRRVQRIVTRRRNAGRGEHRAANHPAFLGR
jgi:hypothetical protein